MNKILVSAPGKIHLLGEHAVVYGKPALLATIDKYCHVEIIPSQSTNITIKIKNMQKSLTLTMEQVIAQTKNAYEKWQQYSKNNDLSLLTSITEKLMDYPIIAIGETFSHYKKVPSKGFTMTIYSEIPIGSGLGSSAALAVSVTKGVTKLLNKKIDDDAVNTISFAIEQRIHGFPSGADNATVCFGGLVWFRKESPDLKIIQPVPFPLSSKLAKNFILIDTGRPVESTGEMVRHVRELSKIDSNAVEQFLYNQEVLTKELLSAIKDNNEKELMQIITQGEKNLEKIEVVSSSTKSIIRTIEKAGGIAKISGAGGIKKGSGILLAYHPKKKILEAIANKNSLPYFTVTLGITTKKTL